MNELFDTTAGREADQDYDLMAWEAEQEAKLWGGRVPQLMTNYCMNCGLRTVGQMRHKEGCVNQ